MKACVLTGFNSDLVLCAIEAPQIWHPSDVIVRVTGAGICGSDVHLIQGAFSKVICTAFSIVQDPSCEDFDPILL